MMSFRTKNLNKTPKIAQMTKKETTKTNVMNYLSRKSSLTELIFLRITTTPNAVKKYITYVGTDTSPQRIHGNEYIIYHKVI